MHSDLGQIITLRSSRKNILLGEHSNVPEIRTWTMANLIDTLRIPCPDIESE